MSKPKTKYLRGLLEEIEHAKAEHTLAIEGGKAEPIAAWAKRLEQLRAHRDKYVKSRIRRIQEKVEALNGLRDALVRAGTA